MAENILDTIIADKYREVEERKSLYPVKLLEKSIFYDTKPVSLASYLLRKDKWGIIAEFKRKSPSKGVINAYADVEQVTVGYMQAGASALSVLTDNAYFGGSTQDLITARKFNYCPILRKDFLVDEYQVIEAKSIGADAILLIAAALSKSKIHELAGFSKSLGMEVLFEIHHEAELEKISPHITIVGVNNRNLKTFDVSLDTSLNLVEKIPAEFLRISESGLSKPESIAFLKKAGYQGFLMGENFMKSSRPHEACKQFIGQIQQT